MINTNTNGGNPIADALDKMSYDYLSTAFPDLVLAIDTEVAQGSSPERLRFITQRHVGADRENLALRVEQAARYMRKRQQVMA